MRALILVNLDANGKKSKKKWERIENEVLQFMPGPTEVVRFNIPFDLMECLHKEVVKKGTRCIISAGGDGTANRIINALWHDPEIDMSEITLGFIGLICPSLVIFSNCNGRILFFVSSPKITVPLKNGVFK